MYKLISKLESSTDPEKLLYEWVKTGVITLMEFRQVVLLKAPCRSWKISNHHRKGKRDD